MFSLNTSHVLIYRKESLPYGTYYVMFKYISCSYLSCQQKELRQILSCLNTSHVLIYPVPNQTILSPPYSLNTSHVLIYPVSVLPALPVPEFKYISCSYLSKRIVIYE